MENETTIRVRYKETDQMGVVYYGNYFTWFEVGRNEFFRKLDLECGGLEKDGVLLPVIEAGCKYANSAKFDDEITIKTELVKLKGVRFRLNYTLYREVDNTLIAEGFTEHAFIDENFKPINMRKKYNKVWNALQNTLEKGE